MGLAMPWQRTNSRPSYEPSGTAFRTLIVPCELLWIEVFTGNQTRHQVCSCGLSLAVPALGISMVRYFIAWKVRS